VAEEKGRVRRARMGMRVDDIWVVRELEFVGG
jgi:hypothetical protein